MGPVRNVVFCVWSVVRVVASPAPSGVDATFLLNSLSVSAGLPSYPALRSPRDRAWLRCCFLRSLFSCVLFGSLLFVCFSPPDSSGAAFFALFPPWCICTFVTARLCGYYPTPPQQGEQREKERQSGVIRLVRIVSCEVIRLRSRPWDSQRIVCVQCMLGYSFSLFVMPAWARDRGAVR